MPILSNNNKILSNRDNSGEWRRPEDWLPMPTGITSANQIFVGLHAIIEDNDNYVAFLFTTSAGQYQVDWGDGSTPTLHNSNTVAQYQYDFTDPALDGTLTSRGYKQAIITVTPVSGNLLTCNFQIRFGTSPAQNQQYSTGFLDCILSMPNATTGQSIIFGGGTVRQIYCERFEIKTIGNATILGTTGNTGLFQNCRQLQVVTLFDTSNVTSMVYLFFECFSLKNIPFFNTGNVTNMQAMFQRCSALITTPLFNTTNVTNMSNMFNACYSLQSVPLFNTSNVTSMLSMFINCTALQSVPLFNTSNVTTMNNMFVACAALQLVPLFNTANVTNMGGMFINCNIIKEIPLFNTSNVTIMNNMVQQCNSLQSFPLLNTSNVTNMNGLFAGCMSLNSIPALSTASITTTSGIDFGGFGESCPSLNRCQMIFARQVAFQQAQLSRDALVEIFTNLVDRSATTAANINISGNWGATALSTTDRDIALNKNWTITG
jgi:surface protein